MARMATDTGAELVVEVQGRQVSLGTVPHHVALVSIREARGFAFRILRTTRDAANMEDEEEEAALATRLLEDGAGLEPTRNQATPRQPDSVP